MRKTPEQIKKFKQAIKEGQKIGPALIAAGYSPAQAKKGKAVIERSHGLQVAYQQALADITSMPVPTPEIRAKIARNRLVQNVVNGEDKAVNSTKLLMQDKEVDILRPDSISGMIVIECPKSIP